MLFASKETVPVKTPRMFRLPKWSISASKEPIDMLFSEVCRVLVQLKLPAVVYF